MALCASHRSINQRNSDGDRDEEERPPAKGDQPFRCHRKAERAADERLTHCSASVGPSHAKVINPIDTLNRDGAIRLGKRREKYRQDQGYPAARFWTEPADELRQDRTYEVYQVKCNLVNGLPPRYRGESD
jgi:hypothetical protein